MTIYAILSSDVASFRVPRPVAYPDRATALELIDAQPADVSAIILESELDLDQECPARMLVDLYNALAERPVERFADRAAGLRRTWDLIRERAQEHATAEASTDLSVNGHRPFDLWPSASVGVSPGEDPSPGTALRERTPPPRGSFVDGADRDDDQTIDTRGVTDEEIVDLRRTKFVEQPAPVRRGRTAAFAPERVIRLLRTDNPKKPGSATYQRYQRYRDGMTVGEALEAGITSADLAWDASPKRNFVRIE